MYSPNDNRKRYSLEDRITYYECLIIAAVENLLAGDGERDHHSREDLLRLSDYCRHLINLYNDHEEREFRKAANDYVKSKRA